MSDSQQVSVILAEELTLLREGLAQICEQSGCYRVVGQCADGFEAIQLIESLSPDIAILDLGLKRVYALTVIRLAQTVPVPPKILVLSTHRDKKTVLEVLRGGASGYLLKTDSARCLLNALREILADGIYISPQLKPAEIFTAIGEPDSGDGYERLSSREHQVFTFLLAGFRMKEIAAQLQVSFKTVTTYRRNLMRKLDVQDIPGLVRFAIGRGLIPPR